MLEKARQYFYVNSLRRRNRLSRRVARDAVMPLSYQDREVTNVASHNLSARSLVLLVLHSNKTRECGCHAGVYHVLSLIVGKELQCMSDSRQGTLIRSAAVYYV